RSAPLVSERIAVRIGGVTRDGRALADFDGAGVAARLHGRWTVLLYGWRWWRRRRGRRRVHPRARVVTDAHLEAEAIADAVGVLAQEVLALVVRERERSPHAGEPAPLAQI